MADNLLITPGSGATAAADDVGGVLYQRIKVSYGADGSAADVEADVGKGLPVQQAPCSHAHLVSTGTSADATSVKASAGILKAVHSFNNAAYPVYAKFHNTAGTPTAGSGVVLTVGCQAGLSAHFVPPGGKKFTTGIAFTLVQGIADSNSSALAASDAVIEVFYE